MHDQKGSMFTVAIPGRKLKIGLKVKCRANFVVDPELANQTTLDGCGRGRTGSLLGSWWRGILIASC